MRAGKFALVTESNLDFPLDTPQVHVYRVRPDGIQNALLPVQTLDSPGGTSDLNVCGNNLFGAGMSAGGGVAAIADPCDSTADTAAGAVHVYKVGHTSLTLRQTLPNPDPAPFAFFGGNFAQGEQTVATDGKLLLVGTSNFLVPDVDVRIYRRVGGGFSLLTSVPNPEPGDPVNGTLYGHSVDLIGPGWIAAEKSFGQRDGTERQAPGAARGHDLRASAADVDGDDRF